MQNRESFLWVEKYRPKEISECILPDHIKQVFEGIKSQGRIPNLILNGGPGTGKTTIAKALCNEIGCDYLFINGSEESGIDVLRTKIRGYASTMSFDGGSKVVILDEADYLNPQSTQPALRGFIEEFANNCRFILTCNFKNRIIEPLHSRCGVYEFNTTKKDLAELCDQFLKRSQKILDDENIKYDQMSVVNLIMKFAPDWRRILNELQRNSFVGNISGLSNDNNGSDNFSKLLNFIKDKDFKNMRQWVSNNIDTDSSYIFRGIYDNMTDHIAPQGIPQVILILADYQYKNAFVADHELNVVACLTEIMANVEFK